LSACEKENDSISPADSELTLKNYSEITKKALLLKTAEGLDLQMGSSQSNNRKQVTRPLTSSGSGTISYISGVRGPSTLKF
jgi:hypothetical protein